ncbi:MAG TPA: hypothetical protein D7H94_00810 [Candidatus Poseidoniales archaeon]|nr:MAG TPA: hypothetical protein D7H94_00810 [Candidatus Poseidoniales archaeon]
MIRRTFGFINGKVGDYAMVANSPSISMRSAPALFIFGWIAAVLGYFGILPENLGAALAILAWTTSVTLILLDRIAKYRAEVSPLQDVWSDGETEDEDAMVKPLANPRELGLDVPL